MKKKKKKEIVLDEMACQDLLQQRRKANIATQWKLKYG
jgi:hypothetical protein